MPPSPGAQIAVETFDLAVAAPAGSGTGPTPVVLQGSASMTTERPVVEQLGRQVMEGVEVDGARSTTTIPAGQIGNAQPILIVSEQWTSPELKVLVMSRQSDPRFGETTYRLTNISRAEPAAHLFEVPPDYRVVKPQIIDTPAVRVPPSR